MKKHHKALTLLFRAIWFHHYATVFCIRLPSPPRAFGAFWCFFETTVDSSIPRSTKKHQTARTLCFVVHFAAGSNVPKSTKKHRLYFFFQFGSSTVFCVSLPSPPSSVWCFSCFLMLFRSCSGFVYTTKQKSTNAVLTCILLWLDCSKKHEKATESTDTAFSFNLVSNQCHSVLCKPPQSPRPFGAFRAFWCFFRSCSGLSLPQSRAFC